ncbi:MAG: methyltransferase domain-containing protein [bacterium]
MQKVPGGNELLNPAKLLKRAGVSMNMHVGDFGCGGMGYFTLQAARMVGDHGRIYAVDILKSALTSVASVAKQDGIQNVRTVWSNVEMYGATKIPAASLDTALVKNVLFQTKKRLDFLREVVRLLKPGGVVMIVDWKTSGSPLGPLHQDRVPPDEVRKIAATLALKEKEAFEAGPYHFGLLFEK